MQDMDDADREWREAYALGCARGCGCFGDSEADETGRGNAQVSRAGSAGFAPQGNSEVSPIGSEEAGPDRPESSHP